MSNIIMDYEGSAEGEGWKVYLDNIFVNWNQFEYAAHRSLQPFYARVVQVPPRAEGEGLPGLGQQHHGGGGGEVHASGHVARRVQLRRLEPERLASSSTARSCRSDRTRSYRLMRPALLEPDRALQLLHRQRAQDIPRQHRGLLHRAGEAPEARAGGPGRALRRFHPRFLLPALRDVQRATQIRQQFRLSTRLSKNCAHLRGDQRLHHGCTWSRCSGRSTVDALELGLKRAAFYLVKNGVLDGEARVRIHPEDGARERPGPGRPREGPSSSTTGAAPWSSCPPRRSPSPRAAAWPTWCTSCPGSSCGSGETVYVISGYYKHGDDKTVRKMRGGGGEVRPRLYRHERPLQDHGGRVRGGRPPRARWRASTTTSWTTTSSSTASTGASPPTEKIRRRVAFSRACAEVIAVFNLNPSYTFTNDAYAGIFNGIVQVRPLLPEQPELPGATPSSTSSTTADGSTSTPTTGWKTASTCSTCSTFPPGRPATSADPVYPDRINCMAAGIRFADRTITVSPSYAKQIEYACDGLERILKNVIGISNAIGRDFKSDLQRSFEESRFVPRALPELLDGHRGRTTRAQGEDRGALPGDPGGPEGGSKSIEDRRRRGMVERA